MWDVWCHPYSATLPSVELLSQFQSVRPSLFRLFRLHWIIRIGHDCLQWHHPNWLRALPIASCGLRFDDEAEAVRVNSIQFN